MEAVAERNVHGASRGLDLVQRAAWVLVLRLGLVASLALPIGLGMAVDTCMQACVVVSPLSFEDDLYLFAGPTVLAGAAGATAAWVSVRRLRSTSPEMPHGVLSRPPVRLAAASLACSAVAVALAWASFGDAIAWLAYAGLGLALAAGVAAVVAACWPTQSRRAALACAAAVLLAAGAGGVATLAVAWLELAEI